MFKKILFGFSIAILGLVIVGAMSLIKLKANQEQLNYLVDDSLYASGLTGRMNTGLQELRLLALRLAISTDSSEGAQLDRQIERSLAQFKQDFEAYKKTDLSGVESQVERLNPSILAFQGALSSIRNASQNEDQEAAFSLANQLLSATSAQLRHDVDALTKAQDRLGQTMAKQARQDYLSSVQFIVGLIALTVFVSLIAGFLIANSVVKPLTQTVAVLGEVARGRLDVTLDLRSNDELGKMGIALNSALEQLRQAMGEIGQNANVAAQASEQLRSSAGEISHGAGSSAQQLAMVANSSEELSSSVQSVAQGIRQMEGSIREISQEAANATQVVGRAVDVTQGIRTTVSQLGRSSQEIGEVIDVISNIAAQTNLLALNASIESARAGDSGKGFAVVASEVKNLAQETADATERIRQRVLRMQTNTTQAIGAMDQIGEIVQEISAGQTQIAAAVEVQTMTTKKMSVAIAKGAAGSGEIAKEVSSLASFAKGNVNEAQASSDAAQEVASMAAAVRRSIGRFSY